MALGTALGTSPNSGISNHLDGGNWSPTIFSKKAQIAFRKTSVIEDITNSDYFGEIANMGDTVKIVKEPDITVSAYTRGTDISKQALDDEAFSLIIDMANYFAFSLDDVEDALTHINWMEMASDRAAYKLRDSYDADVLQYLCGWQGNNRNTTARGVKANSGAGTDELLAANKLDITDFGGNDVGGASEVTSIPLSAGGTYTPLAVLNRMKRVQDQNNIPAEGRWVIVDPVFVEELMDESSKFINNDFGSSGDMLRNGKLGGSVRGFRLYVSNNLPVEGTGAGTVATAGSETHFGVIVAGHDSCVATAQRINKVETVRDNDHFADVVRGLHMYGAKILRPEALVTANYNLHS
jgi:hypothetical protein